MEQAIIFIFILSFVVQLCYFLLFSKIIFYKGHKEEEVAKNQKSVSVVIAAHNEKANLQKLIPLLLNQKYSSFEIIVADDRSSDGSKEYLRAVSDLKLKVISIEKTPDNYNAKKHAITQAIAEASHEIILLTDADCIPLSENWISGMTGKITEEKQIVLGYSGYEKRKGFLNLFIRYETFYTAIQYFSMALIGQTYMGVGRNLAYTKELFIRNKGYNIHSNTTGGDDDLFIGQISSRNNTIISLNPASQTRSIPKETIASFYRQKLRHLSVGKAYNFRNKLKSGILPLSHILFWFSLIFLLIGGAHLSAILVIFILRTLVLIVIFALISRKLGEKIEWLWLPVLDISYLIYYLIAGISAVFSKKTKWT